VPLRSALNVARTTEKTIHRWSAIRYVLIRIAIILFSRRQCDAPWHLKCLNPPLNEIPPGEWFCPDCIDDPGAPVGAWVVKKPKAKRASSEEGGVKRKAPPTSAHASKKKKQ